ncbi:transport complex subunit Cog8 [Schizosaccharomyces cryophilus OY26]|uniref:Conserved oligomeric Golgi complex subunit 8 n=1 Tax=Schizosaccharomyces cryophilus (strain OY26 / ATCC MYA-4695 / CBS 11777 / NBRC 106824 / NRRL Y48691) TaxID=653667 RepID=S9X5Z6_SCHCR|nr:transport complex subunit Cog8 [Schizosaccharomyces cryophilus OY26]EPY49216.1 transport complex subunit Cog8 [Schizosaccharomyces cryophilus OY26]
MAQAVNYHPSHMESYLQELIGRPFRDIQAEKERLKRKSESLEQEKLSYLQSNYKTLVELADCQATTKEFLGNTKELSQNIFGKKDALYNITSQSQQFLSSISIHHQQALLMHRMQPQVSSILKIPELMDSCIQKEYFSEALEFQGLTHRLRDRFASIAVIQDLVYQIEALSEKLSAKFLLQLQKPLKQYTLIKIVTYLRVTSKLSEAEIKYIFLFYAWQQLQSNLKSLIPLLDYNNPELYLKRYLQVIRDRAFSLLFQYQSVFYESTTLYADPANSTVDNANLSFNEASTLHQLDHESLQSFSQNIISSFVKKLVKEICYVLETFLPRVHETTVRSSLLLQLYYCNQSLAKVGTDMSIHLYTILGKEWLDMLISQAEEKPF